MDVFDWCFHVSPTFKGRIFYMPGETAETLFILKEGRVQLYRLSPDGRKLILDTLAPGIEFHLRSMTAPYIAALVCPIHVPLHANN